MTNNVQWQERWQAVMLNNYGTPALAVTRGSGVHLIDAEGRQYLDFVAGIAVSALGHAHPAIVDAVSRQAEQLLHSSNLLIHPQGVELAERLVSLTGWDARVFFAQDGATANEAALKIARRHGYALDPAGGKQRVVSMIGGFHGRTMGALAVTGNPAKRDPFKPFGHEVTFVPFGDPDAVAAAMGDDVIAIITEPVQGENGVVVPPPHYLQRLREIADSRQALLIVDEVQSGVGRTGHWFASTAAGITPDIMTLAKGIAGGLPLGAAIVTGPARDALKPGDHGTTFGGNPVSCAAALAVIDVIEREHLLANVRELGEYLHDGIEAIESPLVVGLHGAGLWLGIAFRSDIAADIESRMRSAGVLVNTVKPHMLRLAPPLVVTRSDIDHFLATFAKVLAEVA